MADQSEFEEDEALLEPESPEAVEQATAEPAEAAETATAETEILNDVTQLYLNEIGAKPLLTPEEEASTARAMRAGDFSARQKMIEHNLRLVRTLPSATSIAVFRCLISLKKATSA